MARQVGCRECDKVTSGDCGQHGPLVMQMTSEVQYQPVAWPELAKKVRAEGYAAGRAEVLVMLDDIRMKLGASVDMSAAFLEMHPDILGADLKGAIIPPLQQIIDELDRVLAQETGKEQA